MANRVKGSRTRPTERSGTRRLRRTPEAARDAILHAGRERLLQHGLEGLKIADVAHDAGMSHATLLHHFGSSDDMRRALVERMADELLAEFVGLLDERVLDVTRLSELITRLFTGLADDRHAQLFAWFALSALDRPEELANTAKGTRPLVAALLTHLKRHAPELAHDDHLPRYLVMLVVSSAIGLGVAAPWLKRVKLLTGRDEIAEFARWFAEFLLARRM